MGRFSQFRVVDSDDTDSEEEPTLQTHVQQHPTGNDGSSSVGSAHGGSDAKRIPPAQPPAQSTGNNTPQSNGVASAPPEHVSDKASSAHASSRHDVAEAPPVVSPDPHNPDRKTASSPSAGSHSSHHSHSSETPSAAQVSLKAFDKKEKQEKEEKEEAEATPSEARRSMLHTPPTEQLADEAPAADPAEAAVRPASPTPSSRAKVSNTALTSARASAASSPAGRNASPTDAAAESAESAPELEMSSHEHSEPVEERAAAPSAVAAVASPAEGDAAPQRISPAPTPAPEAPATEAPKKKKASAGCGLFSSKKDKAQADEAAPHKKAKSSALCGLFSKKKKADKERAAADGPVAEQASAPPVDANVNAAPSVPTADAAEPRRGSDGELSIPVAAPADGHTDGHSASTLEDTTHEKSQHTAVSPANEAEAIPAAPQQPAKDAENVPVDAHPTHALTSHTSSSLSFAIYSEGVNEQEEASAKAKKDHSPAEKAQPETTIAAAPPAAASTDKEKPAKDRPAKRVKAVVRRKRQKPEKDAAADAVEAHQAESGSEAHSSPQEKKKGEEEEAEEAAPAKETSAELPTLQKAPSATPPHASAGQSEGPASRPAASEPAPPTPSGSYGSYSSYTASGSYSYSYSSSYTASTELEKSSISSAPPPATRKAEVVREDASAKTSPSQSKHTSRAGAPAHSSAATSSMQHARETEKPRTKRASAAPDAADGPFTRWSVRADDLILREEDPPAAMPAYQRRILLDLRARERRDAEEAARDLRELTFRPRIHSLPGQEERRSIFIEEARSHSPMGGTSPAFSPASGFSEVSPRRYSIRHISPHLLQPRQAPQQPAPPSFKPEISEFAKKEVSHDRSVFQRLCHRSSPPSPVATPEHAHKPEISDFAKQLYPVPRGTRLPSRAADKDDSAVRRESVFDRLYRRRTNSPTTSPNTSPSRRAMHSPSFQPQITEMARRQSVGMPKEPVGDRLYRNARSPRRENHSPFHRNPHNNNASTSNNDLSSNESHANADRCEGDAETNVNDQGEYDPQRDYATQREYGAGEVVPQSDRVSWSSSSQSSFSVKGPAFMNEERSRAFTRNEAAVEAV